MSPAKKETGRYRVLRDFAGGTAGELVVLSTEEASLLIRDGIVAPDEES